MLSHRILFLTVLMLVPIEACKSVAFSGHGGDKYLEESLRLLYSGEEAEVRYFSAYADLNGDGRDEAIVYVIGPHVCGSGGCQTLVFSPKQQGYELISSIVLTRPPIVVAKSRTRGWRDLIVFVAGGGIIEGYNVRISFDGQTYPESPFIDGVTQKAEEPVDGDVLIVRHSFEEGQPLADPGRKDK